MRKHLKEAALQPLSLNSEAMNFFERRKILKKTSYNDLIPIRVLEHEINEQGKVDVLVPRFKSLYLKRALQTKHRGDYIFIHLDETGSVVWLAIDGELNVEAISLKMSEEHPEKFGNPEEASDRIRKFIALLYQERYITFRQIS